MAVREPLDFAMLLRQYRAAAGLTQEELAERASMSVRGISDLERGVKRAPYRDTVRRLSEALQLSAPDRDLFEAVARGHRFPLPASIEAPVGRQHRVAPSVLVGRQNELQKIEQCIQGEGPPVLFLSGEPGIGKTRLLQEAVPRFSGGHMAVLHAGCHRGSEHEAYSPIVDALAGFTRQQSPTHLRRLLRGNGWLVRLLPELLEMAPAPMPMGNLPADQERRLLFSSVVRFLAAARGASPAILVLDDLHWAGADALELLNVIVRSGEARVIGAFRNTDINPTHPLAVLLADLAHAGLADELPIRPLPSEDAEILLDLLLTQPVAQSARHRMLKRCGGVPFYLTSCARDRREAAHDDTIPWSVAQSVQLRVSMLGGHSQDVLRTAAVIGDSVTTGLLTSLSGLTHEEVIASLDAALAARLMDVSEHRFVFSHDIVRDVIYAELGPATRASLHLQLLEELERLPAPASRSSMPASRSSIPANRSIIAAPERQPSVLARHAQLGGDLFRTVKYSLAAGDTAAAIYAYGEAEYFYRLALDAAHRLDNTANEPVSRSSIPATGSFIADASERLGQVLVSTSRLAEAVELLGEAARIHRSRGDVEGEARAIAGLATADFFRGASHLEDNQIRELVTNLETREPSEALCSLYITLTLLLYGPDPESIQVAERASQMAKMLGNDNLYAEAEVRRGLAFGGLGRWRESGEVLLQTVELAEAVGDPQHINRALSFAGLAYMIQGKLEDARGLIRRAIEVAERHENVADPQGTTGANPEATTVRLPFRGMLAYDLNRAGRIAFWMGDWAEARRCYQRAIELERLAPTTFFPEYLRELAELELAEGRWDEAATCIEELSALVAEPDTTQDRVIICLLATRDLLRGDPRAALNHLLPVLDRFYEGQELYLLIPPIAEEVCVELGDLARTESLLARHGELLAMQGNTLNTPPWLRVKGMLAARQGNNTEAESFFNQALSLAASMPRPLEQARVLRERGRLLARTDSEAARTYLGHALALFRELGARPDTALTERTMAELQ